MSILQALILGLVQGLTEFIPVSSSGHLVLMHNAMGITEGGLSFDVALHIGTLGALLVIFWKDLLGLVRSLFVRSEKTRLAVLLIIATIPAVISGMLLESKAESVFRSPKLVAVNLILVALIMLAAERYAATRKRARNLNDISRKQAIMVGLAQAVAVIPGVSRSGSTITTGIFSGMDRVAATRFSFLLAIPITTGAIAKVLSEGDTLSRISNESDIFIVGIVTALVSGLFAIKFLLKYLAGHSLAVFAYYRIALGLLVLALLFR